MNRPFVAPAVMSAPPPIPTARADSAGRPARPLLIWVRTGTARVRIDAAEFHVAAGEGLWTPASGRGAMVTEPGSVVFPLSPPPGVAAAMPSEPTRFHVPDGWQDWLIQLFNLQVTPLTGRGYSHDAITDLVRRSGAHPSTPTPSRTTDPPSPLDPPMMPSADAARAVAEELLRDPALDLTVQEWASRVLSSPSTVRRGFLADTGLSFEQWRVRCRLSAAVYLLAAGYDADQVAARVGFASRNGFGRAFKQQYEITPYQFCRELSARNAAAGSTLQAVGRADDLARIIRGDDVSVAIPDLLPAALTPLHASDVHVLSWMYRGSGYVDIGDRHYERERGVATWLPAEAERVTGLRENSISLPLGHASIADLQLTEPLQVRFSPAWDDYLMFCSISVSSFLRPDDYDPGHILDLFTEQVAAQRALSVSMPTDPRARTAAMDYLRRIGVSAGSSNFDLPAGVSRAFIDQTGMTFKRWRYAARMRVARDLLAGGTKPSVVARRVGYGHLPNFSAAFTRFHGLSPREYQERETESA